jgi:ketosteroid isomerase-like protein
MLSESVEVVIRFITAVNNRNIESISGLISDDHKFTDSLGNVFRGKEVMTKGWINYLQIFPDYKIEFDEIYDKENKIMFTGKASGTYLKSDIQSEENHWVINAAWRALVENGKIKEWQVFGDNKPVYEILERNRK